MDKVDNLILFNNALMNYMTLLRDADNNLDAIRQDNHTLILKILFSSLIFILNKEDIKTIDEDPDCYINNQVLERIISKICTKKNNKYYMDEIELESKEEVIKTIRDKIAHGAFLIDKDTCNIVIRFNGGNAEIPGEKFIEFVSSLFMRFNYNTNETVYLRDKILVKIQEANIIKKRQNVNPFIKQIDIVKFKFEKNDGTSITPEDKSVIEDLINDVTNNNKSSRNPSMSAIRMEAELNKRLAYRNIHAYCEIEKMNNSIYGQSLKNFIKKNINKVSYLSIQDQYRLVINWYNKIKNNDNVLKTAMFYNIVLLRAIEHSEAKTTREILEETSSLSLWSSIMEMYLSTVLLSFYVHYQYPLENIMKLKDNLPEDEEYFDYSLLDLSFLHPDIFKLPEKREEDRINQLRSVEKGIERINNILRGYREQIDNVSRSITTTSDPNELYILNKALFKVSKNITLAQKEKRELEAKKIERAAAVDEYRIDLPNSYYRNRYLIEYIRNAISHGNVFFDYNETEGNIYKASIRFINDYEGETYLDLNASIIDFNKLFNYDNIFVISEFVEMKKQEKSI